MKTELIISKPYIEYDEVFGEEIASVCSDIIFPKNGKGRGEKKVRFSVSKEYETGLCAEISDAFLIAVLPHCLINGVDIESEAPISRRLLYELKHRLIPELSTRTNKYHQINIIAEPFDSKLSSLNAVGVGWSGGVDCIYTILKHTNIAETNFKITHLANINAGVFEGTKEQIKDCFHLNSKKTKEIAKKLGLKALDIDTNIHELFDENYLAIGPFRLCAAVLALQKLFSAYYISSAYEVSRLSFDENNAFYYEYTICSCLSTQNVLFVESGSETTRLQKIKNMADNPFTQKNLHVCCNNFEGINCSLCGKCVRTIGALFALSKLDLYSEVFDLCFIDSNFDRIMGDILFHKKSQHYAEVLDLLKKSDYSFSKKAIWYSNFLKVASRVANRNRNAIMKKPEVFV